MNELGISLLWVSVQITVLCVFTMLVYLIAGRRRPTVGATTTLSGLMLAALLPIVAFSPWPDWTFSTNDTVESAENASSSSLAVPTQQEQRLEEGAILAEWGLSGFDPTVFTAAWQQWESHRTGQSENGPAHSGFRWEGWLAIVFMTGIVAALSRLVVGLFAVWRIQRAATRIDDPQLERMRDELVGHFGIQHKIDLREFEGITSAATVGWRRPLVLLPPSWREWKPSEHRAVLAHEIAHIAHNDFLRWVCAQVGLLFNFYHPLLHWLARRLRLEQELAADAAAAQVIGNSRDYLKSLAELALRQTAPRVAWPVRTFLPSSRIMARRIEMLRDAKSPLVDRSVFRRSFVVSAVLAVGLLVSGFRQPLANEATAQESLIQERTQQGPTKTRQDSQKRDASQSQFNLRYIPESTTMLVGLRPENAAKSALILPFIPFVDQQIKQSQTGIGVADIAQVLIVGFDTPAANAPNQPRRAPTTILTTNRDVDFTKFIVAFGGTTTEEKHAGLTLEVKGRGLRREAYASLDKRTLIFGGFEQVRALLDATKSKANKIPWANEFQQVANADAVYLMDMEAMRPELERNLTRRPGNPFMATIRPLWRDSKIAVASMRVGSPGGLHIRAWCEAEDGAVRIHDTVKGLIPLAKNMLVTAKEQQGDAPKGARPAIAAALAFGETLLEDVIITRKGKQVIVAAETEMGSLPVLVGLLLPAVQSAREAARRTQSMNNLKMIGLAMHNYHDVNKRFPPAVLLGPDGKTKHSWRVAILPYLDQAGLYKQYKLDEPWDSENNKRVLAAMPSVFRSPNARDANGTSAAYFALVSEETAFGNSNAGLQIRTFTDGTSNTILAVEADRNIPWTKPADIPYDATKPVPKLGGFHQGIFNTVFADGAVHALEVDLDEKTLRRLISRNDGKAVQVP